MNFNLTAPCGNCPFRTDITFYLDPDRAEEIVSDICSGKTFACHKTTHGAAKEESQCAGSLIMVEALQIPHQMFRIAERLRIYDHTKLKMDSPVFELFSDFTDRMEELEDERNAR